MLNLNYNIIGAAKEGFVFPNSASLNYVFTSSVMALGLETNSELTMEVTSSQAPKRREFQTNGMINGIPFKQRTVKARPSSQVNVYYEGIGAWDTTNVPSGSTFPVVEYIVVGGGAAGGRTDGGNNGGGGGQGGIIITGSFPIPFTQYQATMSLAIPQIGYLNTQASYSGFNAVTQSFLTASFTASANTKYDIYATSSINPFVYKVKVLQIGAGGLRTAGRVDRASNPWYTGDASGTYQCSVVSFFSLDNPNVSSSISTLGEFGGPGPSQYLNLTSSGILYATGGLGGGVNSNSTVGGEGITWVNGEVYGSGGGGGRSTTRLGSNGGTNAGNGGSQAAKINYGGGGGGADFTAGAGGQGGLGGSGVAVFRFYDPSGSYVSTGGTRTVTGSYVYHTFYTGSQDFTITVPAAIPY
jgi:hypothetical protein